MTSAPKNRPQKALGQCATCDNQAAPYYQCGQCRGKNQLGYILRRCVKEGALTTPKRGWYATGDSSKKITWKNYYPDTDKRCLPKVGHMPADMLATVTNILLEKGSPATEEEICLAWAKLKAERSSSLVADISCIIAAQRKRDRKSKPISA